MKKIVDIRLRELKERLEDRGMSLQIDDEAKNFLSSTGYSFAYGARPLNRTIQHDLLNPLSVMILSERIRDGETIRVTFDGPHNRLMIAPNHDGTDYMDADDDIEIEDMD
jgi:ATP-dependent Clp protease ATP-binding subunit ClpB